MNNIIYEYQYKRHISFFVCTILSPYNIYIIHSFGLFAKRISFPRIFCLNGFIDVRVGWCSVISVADPHHFNADRDRRNSESGSGSLKMNLWAKCFAFVLTMPPISIEKYKYIKCKVGSASLDPA